MSIDILTLIEERKKQEKRASWIDQLRERANELAADLEKAFSKVHVIDFKTIVIFILMKYRGFERTEATKRNLNQFELAKLSSLLNSLGYEVYKSGKHWMVKPITS